MVAADADTGDDVDTVTAAMLTASRLLVAVSVMPRKVDGA